MKENKVKIRHIESLDTYEIIYQGDGRSEPSIPCRITIKLKHDILSNRVKTIDLDEDTGCAMYPHSTISKIYRLLKNKFIADIIYKKKALEG